MPESFEQRLAKLHVRAWEFPSDQAQLDAYTAACKQAVRLRVRNTSLTRSILPSQPTIYLVIACGPDVDKLKRLVRGAKHFEVPELEARAVKGRKLHVQDKHDGAVIVAHSYDEGMRFSETGRVVPPE